MGGGGVTGIMGETVGGDQTAGVKPMSITGRVVRERERLSGMTAEERSWRMKWLKDQVLAPNEPKRVIMLEKEFMNPIRRFYRFPLDFIFHRLLEPAIGFDAAKALRFYTGRAGLFLGAMYGAHYYIKYAGNDFTRKGGWRVISAKHAKFPGDPGYGDPIVDKKPDEYHDRGFKQSILYKKAVSS